MKTIRLNVITCVLLGGIFCVLSILLRADALSQTKNKEALQWLHIGLKEKELDKKIQAYGRAIELEPGFGEALYNLGRAYKSKQDYMNAIIFLMKAKVETPKQVPPGQQLAIVYELTTLYKQLGRTDEYRQGLMELKQLVTDKKMKTWVAFELGQALYQEGQYEVALIELRSGRILDSEKKYEFSALIDSIEEAIHIHQLYDQAEKEILKGNLVQARALFDQVKFYNTDYESRETELPSFLLNKKLDTKAAELKRLYKLGNKFERQDALEAAVSVYLELLAQTNYYKDTRKRLKTLQKVIDEREFDMILEKEYALGKAALQGRDWEQAVNVFSRIKKNNPKFRNVRELHLRAQRERAQALREMSTEYRYNSKMISSVSNNAGDAQIAFIKGYGINHQTDRENKLSASVDSLYMAVNEHIESDEWQQAETALEQFLVLKPNSLEGMNLLITVRENLSATSTNGVHASLVQSNDLALFFACLITVMILLPVLGFTPGIRAKLYLLCGHYNSAAYIYESCLKANPNKLSLYSDLADVYLLAGRTDATALNIFTKILKLNIDTKRYDEINTLVAQTYLSQGRTDYEALRILEKEISSQAFRMPMNQQVGTGM